MFAPAASVEIFKNFTDFADRTSEDGQIKKFGEARIEINSKPSIDSNIYLVTGFFLGLNFVQRVISYFL